MTNAQFLLKKYSPIILTGTSMVGVVATTILGIKATPKALKLINEAEELKGNKLSKKEIIKVAWKPYIPTAISCITTLGTILSLHILNSKTQNALTAAYATLNNLHQEYVAKTKELYGEDADQRVKNAILNDHPATFKNFNEGGQLFFDYQSLRYFESSIEDVLKAENDLNEEFAASGAVTMNDFYRLLGLEPLSYANEIGWYDDGTYFEIKFENQLCTMDVGGEREDKVDVFIINAATEPNVCFDAESIVLK